MDTETRSRLDYIRQDAREMISRLRIHDKDGVDLPFRTPYNEQAAALQDLMSDARVVVHYKPRQIGRSTVECAYNFHYTYWSTDAVKTLVVAHENDATDAIFSKIRHFNESLPPQLVRPVDRSNRKELIFSDTKAGFRCLTAGGKGQGRAWTYQRLHADELAYWPNAADIWASVTSTLDKSGRHYRVSVLSTANGPGDLFHSKVMAAMEAKRQGDKSVRFRFFRWSDHKAYRMPVPEGWEPSQEEWHLGQVHNLDMSQLFWRHEKIHGVDGIGERRFRREFPLTVEDGFMVFDGSWFDNQYLDEVYASLKHVDGELRIYEQPERGMTYAIGVDPSWCNGGDFAVAQVLSRDGRQVATLSCNEGGEVRFAMKVSELAVLYNRARVLCEANTGGAGPVVMRELKNDGHTMWYDQPKIGHRPSKHPKPWTTHHGNKMEGFAHLRQQVNGDALQLNDAPTVQEMMHIREHNGTISGQDGYHDDHAFALMLAEWNRRTLPAEASNVSQFRKRYTAQPNPFSFQKTVR